MFSFFTVYAEEEIRYITESALKDYTNASLTRVQRVLTNSVPENYDLMDSYVDGRFTWYLYPWFRSFIYDPTQPLGRDIFVTSIGNGNAFGNIARHWCEGHDAKNSEEVRQKIARYYELYQYLVNDPESHPTEMQLFIFTTDNTSSDLSRFNFDDGAYQNLLGVRWHSPEDDNIVEVDFMNKLEIIPSDTGADMKQSSSLLFTLIYWFLYYL